LEVSAEERGALENWARRPKTAHATALRARVILGCAAGNTHTAVARERRVTQPTVGKWRRRFVTKRLDGWLDEPRPSAPRTVTDAAVARVVTLTLATAPRAATHGSPRARARPGGLSQSPVSRIWRAVSLPPPRSETVKRSPDPLFIDQVRDLVGRYLNPPAKALGLCVEEKAQIQARDRSQPLLPLRPGQVERRTPDAGRDGTTSLFAALDPQSGRVLGQRHRRPRAIEFRKFLDTIDATVPEDLAGHLIVDNAATHQTARIQRWLAQRPRYRLHFTPKGASWITRVERWCAVLTETQRRRGIHRSPRDLEVAIDRYLTVYHDAPKPFVWTKTADEILARVARFCHRISDSGH